MNKNIKFIIAALFIAAGVYLMFNRNIGWGIVLVILSAIPILLYYKNEYILLAFWQMRKQDFAKAGDWLGKITNYKQQLHKSQYGYFHYLTGLSIAQEEPKRVESYMKKALDYGLNMKADRAMATLNLAAGALSRGQKNEATRLLEEAKRLDSVGLMTEQIKIMKEQMKMPTMRKHIHNPHMRQRGKYY